MQFPRLGKLLFLVVIVAAAVSQAASVIAQTKVPTSLPGKTIFRDSDGNLITNDEFVDIRMSNFHIPDHTLVRTLDDGTVEFRLQKVPQEGATAPAISLETIHGKAITPEELKGKVLVLNFWFIGCPSCMYEIPKLNELKAKFADVDSVVFVALTGDPQNQVKKFLSREKFDYPVAADAALAMKGFGFSGYPKNIVIGKDGRIVYWRSTVHAWDKFESVIRGELAK